MQIYGGVDTAIFASIVRFGLFLYWCVADNDHMHITHTIISTDLLSYQTLFNQRYGKPYNQFEQMVEVRPWRQGYCGQGGIPCLPESVG